ncbi:GNAT family acetyltransferase [Vibrio sp. HI00D65]|uniref:GNAT family N-acetyltransferase n=1 Tax=Vibrio sp. HI00D65 TaxID=1822216 RepID=UPI0007B79D41|nr:GNAT family N-acetyltransferase [Vibrio sp. HI00D65]KZX70713.1 GNAT family acetyltransferase [Vibrio sp. HI00D65]|tara:strand:+ start:117 stop:590 length:474 start_codon:yes stop_codon:yes gene_type:complete
MVNIRKAARSDAKDIFDIRSRAILDQCPAYYSEEQLSLWTQGEMSETFIADVEATFYVSEVDDRVIGSGKINTQTGVVDAIFVDPGFFGKGAAKMMLQFLEGLANQHNLPLIKLESTLNASAFYRSCGFIGEELSTYHSPRGISLDCIPMEKHLIKS